MREEAEHKCLMRQCVGSCRFASCDLLAKKSHHHRQGCLTSVMSGFPFSTTYVASSAPLPVPTFLTECTAPDGTSKTSPALYVVGCLPSTSYTSVPSRT